MALRMPEEFLTKSIKQNIDARLKIIVRKAEKSLKLMAVEIE
jgi:hypothetical protein